MKLDLTLQSLTYSTTGNFMRNLRVFVLLLLLVLNSSYCCAQIFPPGMTPRKISPNYRFTEGPLYDGMGGILFTNLEGSTAASDIIRYDIATGISEVLVPNSDGANGLYLDPNGKVITADGATRRVSRRSLNNLNVIEQVLASQFNGVAFNGPNDLVIDSTGGIYFTDPNYVSQTQDESVYYINGQGMLSRILTDFPVDAHPNGIMLSPDQKTLYLALQGEDKILSYDVTAPGIVTKQQTFALLDGVGPDGMTIDRVGNLYAGGDSGVWVWNPAGTKLFEIPVPGRPTNVTFGPNETTLYITAGGTLYSIELNIPELASADFDEDGDVDGSDFLTWQRGYGNGVTKSTGDANGDGIANGDDLVVWQDQYVTEHFLVSIQVPEPTTLNVMISCTVILKIPKRRKEFLWRLIEHATFSLY